MLPFVENRNVRTSEANIIWDKMLLVQIDNGYIWFFLRFVSCIEPTYIYDHLIYTYKETFFELFFVAFLNLGLHNVM